MNNAIDKLRGLLNLHQRAAGHSTATVKIANEVNALVVVADRNQMEQPMFNEARRRFKVATLDEIATPSNIVGRRGPVVVDHYALFRLLHEIDQYIRELESRLRPSDLVISGNAARQILINAHAAMWRKYRGLELWVLCRDLTGHGSGYSHEICRSANLKPNQRIGKSPLLDLPPK
jgi:hypothetical protein